MSWLPTLKIARAAYRGSKDPAGLLKSQLAPDEPQERPRLQAAAPRALAPAAAIYKPPAQTETVLAAEGEEDTLHAHVVLLLR